MSGIPAAVVPVVLFAALLHATWNAMAHAVPDRLIGFALIGTAYLVAGGAMAALAPLLAAYGLVLWAQTKAPLAPVAALRETSSLMGAIIGAVVFKESFGRRRVLAAVVVTAGVVLTNL